jgi:ankyrin repeat protein
MGCSLDFSKDRSTPMHCAACFGHYHLIPLLLENGIPIKIKNFCDSFPIDEAATSQIKELLQNADKD